MTNVSYVSVSSAARPQKKVVQSKVQSIFTPDRSRSRSKIGMSQSQRKLSARVWSTLCGIHIISTHLGYAERLFP